jgi:hypothetical protein
MIRGLEQAALKLGIASKSMTNGDSDSTKHYTSPEEIPMMYRAQVEGRCSLMFAGNNKDLERWKDEWIYPVKEQPRYQKKEPTVGLDGSIYRIKVKFPFRLLSNCGQDNIIRPIMGKDGIPFFPGSSVKGIFRRACNEAQAKKYCGDDKNLSPSSLGLRFHGAYPIGDWAGTRKVTLFKDRKKQRFAIECLMLCIPSKNVKLVQIQKKDRMQQLWLQLACISQLSFLSLVAQILVLIGKK